VQDGGDMTAQADMLVGYMRTGQAFANSPVAAVHAFAYAFGGHFHIPHGQSNALVLPHVLRFNPVVAPQPYAELSPRLFSDLAELEGQACADIFCDRLADLSTNCDLPQRLRDMDVDCAILPQPARDAMNQQRLLINNPLPATDADALDIHTAAS